MIIVADASVLVDELLRERGRDLILHPRVRLVNAASAAACSLITTTGRPWRA
jgi:hypothetical protein